MSEETIVGVISASKAPGKVITPSDQIKKEYGLIGCFLVFTTTRIIACAMTNLTNDQKYLMLGLLSPAAYVVGSINEQIKQMKELAAKKEEFKGVEKEELLKKLLQIDEPLLEISYAHIEKAELSRTGGLKLKVSWNRRYLDREFSFGTGRKREEEEPADILDRALSKTHSKKIEKGFFGQKQVWEKSV